MGVNGILNTDTPSLVLSLFDSSLSIIHPLKLLGITVYGVANSMDDIGDVGRASNSIKLFRAQDPFQSPKPLLDCLLQIQSKAGRPVALFAPSDKMTLFMSSNRATLAEKFLFNLPDTSLVNSMYQKHSQLELIAKTGMKVPRTVEFSAELGFSREKLRELELPVFIKPHNMQLWLPHFPVKGFAIETREKLERTLDEIETKHIDVVVQEYIPGPLENMCEVSGYVDTHGELRGLITTVKTRIYPRDLGVGSYMHSTRNPEAEELAEKTIRAIGVRGFFNMELKKHEVTGAFEYIETNLRPWQQISLAHAGGIPFIETAYRDLTGQSMPAFRHAESGKAWMDPVLDYYSIIKDPALRIRDWLGWFLELWRADEFAVFSWNDLRPGWKKLRNGKELLGLAGETFKFLKKSFRASKMTK